MSYYQEYYNGKERAGLNAYGPVPCAFSIFGIMSLIILVILILPSYFMWWFHQKTKVKTEDLPKSNEIEEDEFDGW